MYIATIRTRSGALLTALFVATTIWGPAACGNGLREKATPGSAARGKSASPGRPRPSPVPAPLHAILAEAEGDPVVAGTIVAVTKTGINVNGTTVVRVENGRVPAQSKRDGPNGFLIEPLLKKAKLVKASIKPPKRSPLDKRHCVVLAVHRDLPYRLVVEVLYTLRQASFGCYQVATRTPAGTKQPIAGLPLTSPRPRPVRTAGAERSYWQTNAWGHRYWTRGFYETTSISLDDTKITIADARPAKRKAPRGRISAFVPPVRGVGGHARAQKMRAKIRAHVNALLPCYRAALVKRPRLSGTARISVRIEPGGSLSMVSVVSGMGGTLVRCLRKRIARWRLPKVKTGFLYGPFSVRFTPGG